MPGQDLALGERAANLKMAVLRLDHVELPDVVDHSVGQRKPSERFVTFTHQKCQITDAYT